MLLAFLLPFLVSCRTIKTFSPSIPDISREQHIGFFPPVLSETSGLEFAGDSMITFNDSGGQAGIFVFSPSSPEFPRFIELPGAQNFDWEDVAADSLNLYVGDFGNNSGSRDTLIIYKLNINNLVPEMPKPEVISFSFSEMTAEYRNQRKNPFDCEAMAIIGDSIWLFTKNWQDESSWIYKLPVIPGHYDLQVQSALFPKMLVTGADYISADNLLYLIGYHQYRPRIRVYRLENNILRDHYLIRFGNLPGVQTEGIVINENILYFSNEKSLKKQGLYRINLGFAD